jgi:histidinol-phosphatase
MRAVPGAPDDLALALELADAADVITMARFRAADLVVETKPDLTPVSEADRAVEQALREHLASRRPGDTVFGEEYGEAQAAAGAGGPVTRRWIVDPIDGTKGYVRDMQVWATLLALEENGEMVVGVVSAPAMGRRWWAARGAGAFTSDVAGGDPRPIRVSGVRELSDAQMCFGGFEEWRQTGHLDVLLALSESCWRTRGYGDFWQYMLVAEGAAEIALDPAAALWDLAAPMVIVQEAGGGFTDFGGSATAAGGSGMGSNGLVHEAARRILAGA